MSTPLVILTGLIYLYIAVEQFFKGELGMSMVWLGYAFAQAGMCFVVK